MATATFFLKEPKAEKETLIFLAVRANGKRLKYSTGEKIHPSKWDAEGLKVNPRSKLSTEEKAINTQLGRYREEFEKLHAGSKLNNTPFDLNEARKHFDEVFHTKPRAQSMQLIESIRQYIDRTDKQLETKKGYRTTLNKLIDYEKQTGKALTFDAIGLDFYDRFVDWQNKNGFALNTIGGHIKNLKVFMDVAYDKGHHTNRAFRNKRFKVLSEESVSIYLSEPELEAIYNTDLSKDLRLDRIRDLFIIGCRTGLRFSDLKNLSPEKIIENGTLIRIKTRKTGETVYIPLHWQTREILNKYNFDLPRIISNQKFNNYLKELGKSVATQTVKENEGKGHQLPNSFELHRNVVISRTQGGAKVEVLSPKHELITVHTARRTFATLAYKAGIPAQSIMKITAHRTEKSFLKYVKLTNREHADLMAQHEFFTPLKKVL